MNSAPNAETAETLLEQAEDYTKRRSVNFIGVRKERGAEADANFYDVENFTFNYSYNKTNHRDFEIADLVDENVNAGFVYNHNFKPATLAPFAKKDSLFTGKYWQWLKELNINLLPTSISLNANYNRSFNQQRFRDVLEPGVEGLDLPLLQQRNYLLNWQYALNYSLTNSLRIQFTGSNNNIVRNYFNTDGDPDSGINQNLDLWDGFFDLGEPNRHNQNMQINYELPFSKFPFLSFINAQYSYTSQFDWQRGGDAIREVAGEDINQVQNASTHTLNANLTMQQFYDFLGLKKRDGKTLAKRPAPRRDKAGNAEDGSKKDKKPKGKTSKAYNTFVDLATMVKMINVNYTENRGKVLPGYTQSIGLLGSLRPSVGFVFGSQDNVRFQAARNGWLTNFPDYNAQFLQNLTKNLAVTANLRPTQTLTIDLSADRQYSENIQENYVPDLWAQGQQGLINKLGNFSITTMMIGTAFSRSDEFDSSTFEQFKENRLTVANRLANERGQNTGTTDTDGFPELYGKTQQEVLLPAFYAAYTGQDASKVNLGTFRNIPIPNWNVKYTGLMKNKWFKKKFRRFSIQHGYRAGYSVNNFQSNLERQNGLFNPENGDIRPEDIINNVVLTDQFNPLVRLDFEMTNSFSFLADITRDRTLSLSFDNSLLTEINGNKYTLGLGYRFKDVKFVTNIGGERTRLKGDLNLKADVSLRDNITIIRNLDIDNNQITAGQQIWSLNVSADYALSRNLNAVFFYDHSFSQFKVSTAFPQSTINTGFTLRYNFGN